VRKSLPRISRVVFRSLIAQHLQRVGLDFPMRARKLLLHEHDKRDAIKKREVDRETRAAVKERRR